MNALAKRWITFALGCGVVLSSAFSPAAAQSDEASAVRLADEQFVKTFNAGNAEALAALFHPQGEFIDEQGNIHQGQTAIKELLTKFFAKFPGTQLTINVDSLRVIGPVAIEEGTRTTTTKDNTAAANTRYSVVRSKAANGWPIILLRDYSDVTDLTPHDLLQPLAWLVGEWVNEGSDGAVRIAFRWSEDKNFLLGDFHVTRKDGALMNSSQRIAWDPLAGKVRSWIFDSDGGFGEGHWTQVGDSWVIKSSAVLPDGQTGSATVTLSPEGQERYKLKGTDRIAGDERSDDFEFVVVRKPPTAGK